MSTHTIPFSIYIKKKIARNCPKSAAMGFFQGTQERVRNSRSKRAISVRATEVRLYVHEVLVNRLGGLSLHRKSVVRLIYNINQLLQLCTAPTAWSDSVIRSETSLITISNRRGPIR